MANESEPLTDELFSSNVAFLKENVDNMFVLLMSTIICFLQVCFLPFLNNSIFSYKAGFGMLEAGSVRSKNTTNILVKNFGDLCLGVVAFFVVGYALAFSDGNEWVGDQYFGLVGLPASLLPHVFMQVAGYFLQFEDQFLGHLCCYLHDNCVWGDGREDGLCWLSDD